MRYLGGGAYLNKSIYASYMRILEVVLYNILTDLQSISFPGVAFSTYNVMSMLQSSRYMSIWVFELGDVQSIMSILTNEEIHYEKDSYALACNYKWFCLAFPLPLIF